MDSGKKNNYLKSVEEFQKTFKAPVLDTPQLAQVSRAKLRIDLIQEELNELRDAIINEDLVEVADALCDLQYVLSGAVLEFGMKDIFDDMFDEVHRSNMSKACTSQAEANDTIYNYEDKGVSTYKENVNGKWVVFRRDDHKVLKSIKYSPADLKKWIK